MLNKSSSKQVAVMVKVMEPRPQPRYELYTTHSQANAKQDKFLRKSCKTTRKQCEQVQCQKDVMCKFILNTHFLPNVLEQQGQRSEMIVYYFFMSCLLCSVMCVMIQETGTSH